MMTIDVRIDANLVARARLVSRSGLPAPDHDLEWDEDANPALGVAEMEGRGEIRAHRRDQSVWALVEVAAALITAQRAGAGGARFAPVPGPPALPSVRARRPLPARREGVTRPVALPSGQVLQVTINRDPVTGRLAEVFASSAGRGTAQELELADACIAASLLLQHGCPPAALAKSLHKAPAYGLCGIERWSPATVFGAVVAALVEEEGAE